MSSSQFLSKKQMAVGIDLFSGAGGMSVGAHMAGIDVLHAFDNDRDAASTYQNNFPECEFHQVDLSAVRNFKHLRQKSDCVVFGGPPCQGFSTSNRRNRDATNSKNWMFRHFMRACEDIHPRWIVFENVQGIVDTESGMFLEHILSEIRALGYSAKHGVLNSVDFGVPQFRNRLFVVAEFGNVDVQIPNSFSKKRVTVSQAIGDLAKLKNGSMVDRAPYAPIKPSNYAKSLRFDLTETYNNIVTRNNELVLERYKFIPQGKNWEAIPANLMDNYADRTRCHTGIYRRLDPKAPSVVIGNFRKNMLIHPVEHRGLSVREAARLQSFPDWFRFYGSIGFQQQQVGNAVPPLLAKAVFDCLLRDAAPKEHGDVGQTFCSYRELHNV